MEYNTQIAINGKRIAFERITLNQKLNEHHNFEVHIDHDTIEEWGSHTIENSKAWLGTSIVITFNETEFLGVITNVKLEHQGFHHQGYVVVSGYSKTILLEQGLHTTSWYEKSLEGIVRDVIDTVNLETQLQSDHKGLIPYQAQYGESHFTFLKRLAKQHNQWLYWDGIKLHFGKPLLEKPIRLEYGKDIANISIGIDAKANTYSTYSYNALEDTLSNSKSKANVQGLNELGMHAFDTSLGLFHQVPNTHNNARTRDKSELDANVEKKQAAAVANLNTLEADCSWQGLTVGSVIKVSSAKWDGKDKFDIKNYGEYLVTEIQHQATRSTTYSCHFKAIPSGVKVCPEPEVSLPQAHAQIAKVIDNEDPQQKGRVQVQFQWMQSHQKTNWIRVMTPDAGSSEQHSTNRGLVFIPEVGDQVMVGFRYGDPNRPFVMGSMFHGQNGAGGSTENTQKSIITRSGHVIAFNDTKRAESITITDKNKNIIFIDTANSSIHISAPENISISAKNIDISASENLTASAGENMGINAGDDITMGAGKDVTVTASEDMTILAKNITEQASENFESIASNIEEQAATIAKNSTESDINVNSSGKVNSTTGGQSQLF